MAGWIVRQRQKAAQERLLRGGEFGHVDRVLPAAQHRAECNEQEFVQVMQLGIAGARVFQPFPARCELIQRSLPSVGFRACW